MVTARDFHGQTWVFKHANHEFILQNAYSWPFQDQERFIIDGIVHREYTGFSLIAERLRSRYSRARMVLFLAPCCG
ncbi:hypothetical protein HME9302_00107 [Alteripontixanthobacter maritimus]|uniref:Uncharacterized protein n=1 Tax=Alteripontixanthobacter maritimus TaxID=2161824 RepID=A0A369Q1Z2_9SPHN|nr:hypothetical protein HME9302_00107 [Alteripontixanthobacter maritimus]